jgi:raffinose/stachyose/melibiose transport system permease protein
MKKRKRIISQKEKNIQILSILLLTLFALCTLFPIYFLFINSFKSQTEIVASSISLPNEWKFSYLINAAIKIDLFQSLINTIIITICSVLLIVFVSITVAWVMVRSKSKIFNILFLIFASAMLIPFQSVMYPLVSFMEDLNLKNTFGLILMYAGFGLSMSVLFYHGFLKSVPLSLEEAAVLDGANIFELFRYVIFPLVMPTTATVIIINAVWIWNDYLLPFLVIGNNSSKTLTLSLYYAKSLSGQYGNPWELIFPAVLISVLPIMLIFIILQRSIIEGISAGAVKG